MGIIRSIYFNINFDVYLNYYAVLITSIFGDFYSIYICIQRFMRSSVFTHGLRIDAKQRRDPASHSTTWRVNIFNNTVGGINYG